MQRVGLATVSTLIGAALLAAQQPFSMEWSGSVVTANGQPAPHAEVQLELNAQRAAASTNEAGAFHFSPLERGVYRLSVSFEGKIFHSATPLAIPIEGLSRNPRKTDAMSGSPRQERPIALPVSGRAAPPFALAKLTLLADGSIAFEPTTRADRAEGSGGETLSSNSVTAIPLNKRDFSQLLLLAAGTMTDANGATNFTQQFAINGQRGVEAVFAMDGADTTDPEMGGATLSNFNVDAVQEIQSTSGWNPADIGRGAAGLTNVITRAGTNAFHGSLFEFLRNSAFDARNFFDARSPVNPGRIPPFRRNEFGFTLGGPITSKSQFFAEYQGFRQVLGTTQVLAVPTAAERSGLDTTAFPGDTLRVPIDPTMAAILQRYPLPNDSSGPFGARTFATSSKVATDADQFSVRIDHQLTSKDRLFARFTWDNLSGPTTNPDQTAIDPAFGITYIDHQRNAELTWIRTASASFSSESSLSYTRTTPNFPTPDHTDPSIVFGDGLYEGFDTAGGSVTELLANFFQARQNFTWTRSKHTVKAGAEIRINRDTTYFGTAANGQYTFGGGTAYAISPIASASGLHNIAAGQLLPDTLSAFLEGSAFAYTGAVAPAQFPQGSQIGVAAISRNGINLYIEDTWKISDRFVLDYGVRYELYSPISERAHRTAGIVFNNGPNGPEQFYLINPDPAYRWRGNNWGPRARLSWQPSAGLWIRAGAGLTTIPPNIWQDNLLTGAAPYVDYPRITAAPGAPLPIGTRISPAELPPVYNLAGVNVLASGNSQAVPANTIWDVNRFETALAALTPSHLISPLNANAISPDFHNAYLGTWSFMVERSIHAISLNAGYVGTAGIDLPAMDFPNAFTGATAAFAPYTQFNSAGQITGGFGTDTLLTNRSHSTYHSLQSSATGTLGSTGPQIQLTFTWSKSLDHTSSVLGPGVGSTSGAIALAWPQNPFDTRAEKGPSTFDVGKVFTATAVQDLHADRAPVLHRLNTKFTQGWQLLGVATLTSGSPFTVYSGVQETGAGSIGTDRPNQIGQPDLSTSRKIREDYFGLGPANAAFFAIPTNGTFGALGRDTFRGPGFHNFDFALIKDTTWETSPSRSINLQFRSEFFNLFNIVNFGLPSNVLTGSGFGLINRTASNSRQIQFSLKTMF